ncbi:MAG: hypothetical protein GX781_00355 [Clostridiales bacterium]|nr:hypothetical protein [Clostridiales bacterium]
MKSLLYCTNKVIRLAISYQETLRINSAVDPDDLLQAYFLGVEAAARSFDADLALFSTYSLMHIRNRCRISLGLKGRQRLENYR